MIHYKKLSCPLVSVAGVLIAVNYRLVLDL